MHMSRHALDSIVIDISALNMPDYYQDPWIIPWYIDENVKDSDKKDKQTNQRTGAET